MKVTTSRDTSKLSQFNENEFKIYAYCKNLGMKLLKSNGSKNSKLLTYDTRFKKLKLDKLYVTGYL